MRTSVLRVSAQGFTLMEIMVVVVIVGILAALVAPAVVRQLDKASATAAKQHITTIEKAVEMFRMDAMRYPSTDEGLQALMEAPSDPAIRERWHGPYLHKVVPDDPWGRPYIYTSPGREAKYDVYSLGADGAPGGEGTDADILNWEL